MADEVLYHSRIHPSCPVPALTAQNIKDLHHQLRHVCQTAVDVNADSLKFPPDWLFRWRWSKGKKQANGTAKRKRQLESGDEAAEEVKPKGMSFLPLVR